MAISLSNYQPFDYTKAVIEFGKEKWNSPVPNCLILCKKVGSIALAILAFLPALVIDLVLTAGTLLYRACYPAATPARPPPAPVQPARPPAPAVQPAVQANVPDQRLVNRVLATPYPGLFPFEMDNQRFFRDALVQAFGFHNEATKTAYKELIENGGVGDNPPIDIYQWTAGCLVAHFLRARPHSFQATLFYPRGYPDLPAINGHEGEVRQAAIVAHLADMGQLWDNYNALPTREEKASTLLKIIMPERQWQLTNRATQVVNLIHGITLRMNQDPHYRREIFRPVTDDIDNI